HLVARVEYGRREAPVQAANERAVLAPKFDPSRTYSDPRGNAEKAGNIEWLPLRQTRPRRRVSIERPNDDGRDGVTASARAQFLSPSLSIRNRLYESLFRAPIEDDQPVILHGVDLCDPRLVFLNAHWNRNWWVESERVTVHRGSP